MDRMDQMNRKLDALFAAYGESFAERDASADFMPGLWERIEARRSFSWQLWRMSRVAVAATAALNIALAALVILPRHTSKPEGTYLDVLAEAHPGESLAALGLRFDSSEAGW